MTGFTNGVLSIRLDIPTEYVLVTTPQKKTIKIPTFIDEIGTYWFRFSSSEVGSYTFSTAGADQKNEGVFELEKYSGTNLLYTHGRIYSEDGTRYLNYADGTPFFWLADTWWFAMTNRASWPEVFQKIVSVRKKQGFTVSQVVVGYPPEVNLDSDNAQNKGGFPLLPSGEINPKYFQEVDLKITHLVESGIVPCIFGGWGHHIDLLGIPAITQLWHEIIARYAAYPVVFCLAGEVDLVPPPGYGGNSVGEMWAKKIATILPSFLKKTIKKLVQTFSFNKVSTKEIQINRKKSITDRLKNWSKVAEYITHQTPFVVPLTAHISQHATAGQLFNHPSWLDIDSFQSGHAYDRRGVIVADILPAAATEKKIINLEPWYEQISGKFGAVDQRYAFWMSVLAGATGTSYGAHGLWNMATKADPFLSHWGVSTWQTALTFPGAEQIGRAKSFLNTRKWWLLEAIPEIIVPHWQVHLDTLPLAAKIESEVLIYFPAQDVQKDFQLDTLLLPASQCTLSWYDPATFQLQKKEAFSQEEIHLQVALDTDILLCISPAGAVE